MQRQEMKGRYHGLRTLTLVETLVVVGVVAIVAASSLAIFSGSRGSWRGLNAKIELVENARWALDFVTKEIQGVTPRNLTGPGGGPARDIGAGCSEFFADDTEYCFFAFIVDDINNDSFADTTCYWRGDDDSCIWCEETPWWPCSACFGKADTLYRGIDHLGTEAYRPYGYNGDCLLAANYGERESSVCVHYYSQPIARFLTDNPIDPATGEPYLIFSEECRDVDNNTINDSLYINIMLTMEHPERPGKKYTFKRKVHLRNINLEQVDPDGTLYCQ